MRFPFRKSERTSSVTKTVRIQDVSMGSHRLTVDLVLTTSGPAAAAAMAVLDDATVRAMVPRVPVAGEGV